MSHAHSSPPAKASKPYPEFPLTAHPAGYWCKKIRGKIHYFGPWADPDGATPAATTRSVAISATTAGATASGAGMGDNSHPDTALPPFYPGNAPTAVSVRG
jgi:hypothetical protein